jgi:hypothetical protein
MKIRKSQIDKAAAMELEHIKHKLQGSKLILIPRTFKIQKRLETRSLKLPVERPNFQVSSLG